MSLLNQHSTPPVNLLSKLAYVGQANTAIKIGNCTSDLPADQLQF